MGYIHSIHETFITHLTHLSMHNLHLNKKIKYIQDYNPSFINRCFRKKKIVSDYMLYLVFFLYLVFNAKFINFI